MFNNSLIDNENLNFFQKLFGGIDINDYCNCLMPDGTKFNNCSRCGKRI